MPSKHDPPKDHSHYGGETTAALHAFQDAWVTYQALTWTEMRENYSRLDVVQSLWDRLARARKEETGTGFYVDKEKYAKLHQGR